MQPGGHHVTLQKGARGPAPPQVKHSPRSLVLASQTGEPEAISRASFTGREAPRKEPSPEPGHPQASPGPALSRYVSLGLGLVPHAPDRCVI